MTRLAGPLLVCALALGGGHANAQAGATPPPESKETAATHPPTADDVCRTLEEAAAENALPVEFFARVIWQESRFNARAVSPKGASGIAQFMPQTAGWHVGDPGQFDMAPDAVNDDERKIGHMLAPATISIMEVTVATSRERMAAHRARRCKSLVQRTVTIAEADLGEIASCGYPDVKSDDKVRAAEALGLFISDTVPASTTAVTLSRDSVSA
jgi:hypothetical protein